MEALLVRCGSGDARAFETVYRHFAGGIYRHLCVLVGPGGEAEDAMQTVFLEAFRKLSHYRRQSKFETWLHGIAVGVAMNTLRARRRRSAAMTSLAQDEAAGGEVAISPEAKALWVQQAGRLHAYLGRLTEEKQVAFLLYYVEHLQLAEIAAQLRMTPAATWARIKRARDEMVRALEADDGPPLAFAGGIDALKK